MQQIERGMYYEDNYLGVTLGGLVYAHGSILIDAPLRSEDARSWRTTLLNQRGGVHRLLILLDAHPDRTLGARTMDCTVLSHQRAAQILRNRPAIFKGQNTETGAVWEVYGDAIGMRWANPDITFTDRMSLHWGGSEVILEYHPGPSQGAIWVIIPDEKVVFVGDAVVLNQPPFLANADIDEWLQTLQVLEQDYSDYVVVSGRGGPASIEDVQQQIHYLEHMRQALDQLAEENEPPEMTEGLVARFMPALRAGTSYPPEWKDRYVQRLRHGLFQYYSRRYHSLPSTDELELEEPEA